MSDQIRNVQITYSEKGSIHHGPLHHWPFSIPMLQEEMFDHCEVEGQKFSEGWVYYVDGPRMRYDNAGDLVMYLRSKEESNYGKVVSDRALRERQAKAQFDAAKKGSAYERFIKELEQDGKDTVS